jgi:NADH-quinone oxidoreductase subunit N
MTNITNMTNMTNFDIFDTIGTHLGIETILPELFFVNAIFILLLFGTFYNASAYHKYPIMTYSIGYLSIQSILITLFLILNAEIGSVGMHTVILNNVLILDDFTLFVKVIVLLSTLATLLISFSYTVNRWMSARICEYMILILFSTLSMLLVISSFDLISMYLAIELQSLSFYILAAFQRNNEFSTEAGLKYFILGALTSGLLLFGESLVYGFTGLTNFEELTKLLSVGVSNDSLVETSFLIETTYTEITPVLIGVFFILMAFLFKIGSVPFHLWTPDVYEGAPTSVTAFFSITPKIAVLALLLRLCMYTFYDLIESWQYLIICCAFLSMLIGTLGAINQNKIKRLLAYSSIAHVGYILVGLATGTIESIEALLIYSVLYTLTVLNIFSVLLASPTWEKTEAFSSDIHLGDINTQTHSSGAKRITFTPTLKYLNLHCSDLSDSANTTIKGVNTVRFPSLPDSLVFASHSFFIKKNESSFLILGHPGWDPFLEKKTSAEVPLTKSFSLNINRSNYINWKNSISYIKHIADFSSLAKTNPILALTAAIVFFSNAGIPPLAGFYGKLNIFLTAVENSMFFLAFSGILCSVMGAFYSIRLVKIIYFHSMVNEPWPFYQSISKENALVLAFTFFFTLFFFLTPSLLFLTAHSAALSLCL